MESLRMSACSCSGRQSLSLTCPGTRPLSGRAARVRAPLPALRCAPAPPPEQQDPSNKAGAPEPQQSSGDKTDQSLGGALSRSLTEVAKTGNRRIFGSTNLLLAGETEEQWKRLDQKVNKYPLQRSFTAIGTGGQEFRAAMVEAVQSVVGSVHCECISERYSSQGAYISVTIGPVWVENGDQIINIYAKMKTDGRAKWII